MAAPGNELNRLRTARRESLLSLIKDKTESLECPMRDQWSTAIVEIINGWRNNTPHQAQKLEQILKRAALVKLVSSRCLSTTLPANDAVAVDWLAQALRRFGNFEEPARWQLSIEFGPDWITFSRKPIQN